MENLIFNARSLIPSIRERAINAEDNRKIPIATVLDMKEAGFCRMYTPKRFGGLELDWGVHCKIAEEIGLACGSSAWFVAVVLSHSWMIARFCSQAQEEVLGNSPDTIIATAFSGKGEMLKVKGGYMVSGQWSFASGIHHAEWTIVGSPLSDPNQRTSDARPPYLMAILKADQYEIIDDWYSEGLKATGSNSLKVIKQFVPEHLTEISDNLMPASTGDINKSYIYNVEFVPYLESSFVGPLIGVAKGALKDYLEYSKHLHDFDSGKRIAEDSAIQSRVAESIVEIDTANQIVDRVLGDLHILGMQRKPIVGKQWVMQRLKFSFASRLCVSAVNRLVSMMGARGLKSNNPVQRHYRDIRAISSHTSFLWDRASVPVGKWSFGLSVGDPSVDDCDEKFNF